MVLDTHHSEGFQTEHEHRKLNDLVYKVRRVDLLAGGLKIQYEQVVQTVRVGLYGVMQFPGRIWLL